MRRLLPGRPGDDEGFALASVIGLMLLGALIVSLMLTATLRSIGSTTATRASVQAKAAAQTGIDDVRAMLAAGTCVSGTVTGTNPGYTVTLHPSNAADATASLPIACPSASSRSVFLVSTGRASARGVGSDDGNVRTVEALFTKPAGSPKFNKAMFGLNGVNVSTNVSVHDSTGTNSADIFTEGKFNCASAMTLEGSLYARGDINFSSSPCTVNGSVLTEGDFQCSAGTTIGGNLLVGKTATFQSNPCDVLGMTHAGINVVMPNAGTKLGTSVLARGSLIVNGVPSTTVNTITLGGVVSGSHRAAIVTAWGPRLAENQTVGAPPAYPVSAANEFPRVTADDASITSGFTTKPWGSTVLDAMSSGSKPGACNLNWGGNRYPSPIVISENTRFDTRTECAGGITLGMSLWFELKADLVIVADQINQNGNTKFTSGDGQKHSVYLVNPWPASATTCSSTASPGIELTSGTWTQDPKLAVLMYSARPISVKNTPVLTGQMYGCTMAFSTSVNLTYTPVGSVVDPATTPWSVSFVRDRG